MLVTTCLNRMLCRQRVKEVKTKRGRNLPVFIDRCGIWAIKNNGCKWDKFGCDMQVLNKKANSKRGRV
jgi:hypothetical protein